MTRMYTGVDEVYVNGLGWVPFKASDACLRIKLRKEDKITQVKLKYIDCSDGAICGDGVEELSIDSDIRRYTAYVYDKHDVKVEEIEFFCKEEDKLGIMDYINNSYKHKEYSVGCFTHGKLSSYVNIKLKIETL